MTISKKRILWELFQTEFRESSATLNLIKTSQNSCFQSFDDDDDDENNDDDDNDDEDDADDDDYTDDDNDNDDRSGCRPLGIVSTKTFGRRF